MYTKLHEEEKCEEYVYTDLKTKFIKGKWLFTDSQKRIRNVLHRLKNEKTDVEMAKKRSVQEECALQLFIKQNQEETGGGQIYTYEPKGLEVAEKQNQEAKEDLELKKHILCDVTKEYNTYTKEMLKEGKKSCTKDEIPSLDDAVFSLQFMELRRAESISAVSRAEKAVRCILLCTCIEFT
jgi:hypothetical protein